MVGRERRRRLERRLSAEKRINGRGRRRTEGGNAFNHLYTIDVAEV